MTKTSIKSEDKDICWFTCKLSEIDTQLETKYLVLITAFINGRNKFTP
jgi:hypothetical protein